MKRYATVSCAACGHELGGESEERGGQGGPPVSCRGCHRPCCVGCLYPGNLCPSCQRHLQATRGLGIFGRRER